MWKKIGVLLIAFTETAIGGEMKIWTPAFDGNQPIPKKFTGEGADVSPSLKVEGTPSSAVSLALIVDDPDAPHGVFVHWVAWNIPANTTEINEGAQAPVQGKNDFGQNLYRGPMPPPGKAHRYFFKVFALDKKLDLPPGSSKADLVKAMQGHIVGQAELVGTYKR